MRASERKRKRKEATPVHRLVEELLAGYGVQDDVRERRIVTGWRDAVGDQLAAHAWPDGLKAGVLHVRVANSAWLHQVSFVKDKLVERVNAVVGDPPLVRDVRFHVGTRRPEGDDDVVALLSRRRPRRPRPVRPLPAASPELVRRIEAETAGIADEELREAIRSFRRLVAM